MSRFFLYIYDWFTDRKAVFYSLLVLLVLMTSLLAYQIRFKENITSFFGKDINQDNQLFKQVKTKDKIIVMVSGRDPDRMVETAEKLEKELLPLQQCNLIKSVTSKVDAEAINGVISFIYDHLPIFMDDHAYNQMASQLSQDSLDLAIKHAYDLLSSPAGMMMGDMVLRDPLAWGYPMLQKFEKLNPESNFEVYSDYLFTKDLSTLLIFIRPTYSFGETSKNKIMVEKLEEACAKVSSPDIKISSIGAPIVAVYNSAQIKKDTTVTMLVALIVVLLVLCMAFRSRKTIPLIIVPPAFGALFSLACIRLLQGEISIIATGAGSVVLGISLSYAIHIIAHVNHIPSSRDMIKELSTPLTIGSFTTIGAFAALCFTSSALLRDMGLFAVFALIGTVLFCLIFLPHFLSHSSSHKPTATLRLISKVVSYPYERNKWVISFLACCTIVALFYCNDVRFNDDMGKINYMPRHLVEAEQHSRQILGDKEVYILTGNKRLSEATKSYETLCDGLQRFCENGEIKDLVTVSDFFIAPEVQQQRITRWHEFWKTHGEKTILRIRQLALKSGLKANAFAEFEALIHKKYTPCFYTPEQMKNVPAISHWMERDDNGYTVLSRITIDNAQKDSVYRALSAFEDTSVLDRAYFSSRMVDRTGKDFNYILWVSSAIVFIALLLSYGRIELALLTFLPMCVSWVIILGLMAVLGIGFNIVNVILATFIFGTGDDFSIFIMDGLLQKYKNGQRSLEVHKTAIFFSAFTTLVGMGVLIFARHPALRSVALISVLGLAVVVLVSYTIQPLIFRLFISRPVKRGGAPYTFLSLLISFYTFSYFLLGCLILHLILLVFLILPVSTDRKRLAFNRLLYVLVRFYLSTLINVKIIKKTDDVKLVKPSIIIANHQSFLDILLLLSAFPKIIMITNGWVYRSPFFGLIIRYAGFLYKDHPYLGDMIKQRMQQGYSVVIFPEGTRSVHGVVRRFHKGAFYYAKQLQVDILSVVIYGADMISAKHQPFYVRSGIVVVKAFKAHCPQDMSMGVTYQQQAVNFRKWFARELDTLRNEYSRSRNPFFRESLILNYTYKGPVLEWYMRVKCRLDHYYDMWDKTVPRHATVTDMGCGYGQLSLMLASLSPQRTVYGLDHDSEKISLATHVAKYHSNISFDCADMRHAPLRLSDVFVFNDSLHYVKFDDQKKILSLALQNLSDQGMLIIRDADPSKPGQHKIDMTEKWSTSLLHFNKNEEGLHFFTSDMMQRFAEQNNLSLTIRRCDKKTSETLFILKKQHNAKV